MSQVILPFELKLMILQKLVVTDDLTTLREVMQLGGAWREAALVVYWRHVILCESRNGVNPFKQQLFDEFEKDGWKYVREIVLVGCPYLPVPWQKMAFLAERKLPMLRSLTLYSCIEYDKSVELKKFLRLNAPSITHIQAEPTYRINRAGTHIDSRIYQHLLHCDFTSLRYLDIGTELQLTRLTKLFKYFPGIEMFRVRMLVLRHIKDLVVDQDGAGGYNTEGTIYGLQSLEFGAICIKKIPTIDLPANQIINEGPMVEQAAWITELLGHRFNAAQFPRLSKIACNHLYYSRTSKWKVSSTYFRATLFSERLPALTRLCMHNLNLRQARLIAVSALNLTHLAIHYFTRQEDMLNIVHSVKTILARLRHLQFLYLKPCRNRLWAPLVPNTMFCNVIAQHGVGPESNWWDFLSGKARCRFASSGLRVLIVEGVEFESDGVFWYLSQFENLEKLCISIASFEPRFWQGSGTAIGDVSRNLPPVLLPKLSQACISLFLHDNNGGAEHQYEALKGLISRLPVLRQLKYASCKEFSENLDVDFPHIRFKIAFC